VPVYARRLFRVPPSPTRRRAKEAAGSSGLPGANEAGGHRGSQRDTHFDERDGRLREGRCLPFGMPSRPPLAPLSPPLERRGAAVATSTPWPRGRQDRFRAYLVKGARFPDPRCLPPLARPHNPSAPKCKRTCDVQANRYGAHVMRIAETPTNRPRFTATQPLRSRAPRFVVAKPPFTGPGEGERLSTSFRSGTALLWATRRASDFCKQCETRAPTTCPSIPRIRWWQVTTLHPLGSPADPSRGR
jgi:hypothetical protein